MSARTTLAAAAIGAALAASASADIGQSDSELEFFAPEVSWRVRVPKQGWVLLQETRKPDGAGYYYFAGNQAQGLQFSIYLDRTSGCTSGAGCRAAFWRNGNPGPMYKDPKAVRLYERNGFHVVEFYVDGIGGLPVKQANVSAHMYRSGYWVDVRVTKVDREIPNLAPLVGFLDSIAVK
jgi:hypothetical protein